MDKLFLITTALLSAINLNGQDIEQEMRNGQEVSLSASELENLRQIEKIKQTQTGGIVQHDGSIQYKFGNGIPILLCGFMKSCEILLEKGEVVDAMKSITMTDARIQIVPMITEVAGEARSSVVITPLVANLETNLHILTDKRNYLIAVKSTKRGSFPRISFHYGDKKPNGSEVNVDEKKLKREEIYEKKASYDTAYVIDGEAPWQPVSAFFTGEKTVIEFKSDFSLEERPTLHRFVGDKKELVNYRVVKNKYIVDYRLDRGVLSLNAKEVVITHKNYKPEDESEVIQTSFLHEQF